jgi:hypothetical protein
MHVRVMHISRFAADLRDITTAYTLQKALDNQGSADSATASATTTRTGFDLIIQELQDGIDMLVFRCQHVALLYQATAPYTSKGQSSALVSLLVYVNITASCLTFRFVAVHAHQEMCCC